MMSTQLSQRACKLNSSAIREILKVASSPDVISFAGGIPAPETFPVELLRAVSDHILTSDAYLALQYSLTEGYLPLRQWIADRHRTDINSVLVTTGSQQALDLLAKALIDPGVQTLVESPTYLGALQAFSLFDPNFVELSCDGSGIMTRSIVCSEAAKAGLAYVMPNFQNPTGRVMSASRRSDFSHLMKDAGVLVIEDDPYGELNFKGEALATLQSINPAGVAYLGSFSKVLAPGLRVGYVVAPPWLIHKLVQIKQAADLHTSSFDQRLVYEVIVSGEMGSQISRIRSLYARRCSDMLNALAINMPKGVRWTEPEGGMFLWLTLPEEVDATVLLERALGIENDVRVAFVPGASFFASNPQMNTLRLSFVTMDKERMNQGIRQLAAHLRLAIAGPAS